MSRRVRWTYLHWLNSISSLHRTKTGTYYGKIKHTYKHWKKAGAVQMACVQFDGNKHASIVPLVELEFIESKPGADPRGGGGHEIKGDDSDV